jgi:hypothetical protein
MNGEQKQRLLSLFQDQNLSQEVKEFWLSRLTDAPSAVCESILGMFALFPGEIGQLRVIQERKEQALASGDAEAWKGIVADEMHQFATSSEESNT